MGLKFENISPKNAELRTELTRWDPDLKSCLGATIQKELKTILICESAQLLDNGLML